MEVHMGSIEVGGNGSVIWDIDHGDGDYVYKKGNKDGGRGKDKEPKKGTGGKFTVIVNGVQLAQVDLDTSKIVILWGNSTVESVENAGVNVPMIEKGKPADAT
jgi:hypothetical protein